MGQLHLALVGLPLVGADATPIAASPTHVIVCRVFRSNEISNTAWM